MILIGLNLFEGDTLKIEEIVMNKLGYSKECKRKGGGVYIPENRYLEFVKKCKEESFLIIGIEGFILEENKTIPRMDMIADFSNLTSVVDWDIAVERSSLSSHKFFESVEKLDNLYFNFVCITKDEAEELNKL